MVEATKKWYQSKTKLGAVVGGAGVILTTVGAFMQGSIDIGTFIPTIMTEVGVVLGLMGIRDIPIINK